MSRYSSQANNYTRLTGYIQRETEKAVQFKIDSPTSDADGCTWWLPLSQIKSMVRNKGNDLDVVEISDWLLDTKLNERNDTGD